MKYLIDLDLRRCVACGACTVACMDQNDIEPQFGDRPLRRVTAVEEGEGSGSVFTYLSMACMHCSDAICIAACPVGCISRDEETGFVVYDNARCIGCRSCALACPFGAPTFDRSGKMRKCDGCNDRVKAGLEPACVRVCPVSALKLTTEEEYLEEAAADTALSLTAAADALRSRTK